MFNILREIIQIAYSREIKEERRQDLNKLSRSLTQLTKKLDTVHKYKVFPKLHFLSHYADYIKRFGPLVFKSSLIVERKHQTFTDWAKVMGCFKNPAFSFVDRHQSIMVLQQSSYMSANFFEVSKSNAFLFDKLPQGYRKLKQIARNPIHKFPHTLNKNVLRRFVINDQFYWIKSEKFLINAQNQILAEGLIFRKSANTVDDHEIVLEKCFGETKFILTQKLNRINDFLSIKAKTYILKEGLM